MNECLIVRAAGLLGVVGVMMCMASIGPIQGQEEGDWTQLQMNSEEWQFVEGAWEENDEGIVTAPGNNGDENLAFYVGRAYADFEAEFEFRWDIDRTNAGFVFRARDARHYYMVHSPSVGQQYRAEHFWAAISKVDESGFVQVLNMEMVHGVSSAPRLWHKVRVTVAGNEIRAWVDGRPLSVLTDDTYTEAGYVGLATYSMAGGGAKSSFRNLRIRGVEAPPPAWDASVQPERNWFWVTTAWNGCGNINRAPNGDLLVGGGSGLLRSTDNGRTWSEPEPLPEGIGGLLHTTPEGLLTMQILRHDPPFQLLRATSTDNGKTWSEPVQTGEVTWPPEKPFVNVYIYRLLELRDGSLLMFAGPRTLQEVTIMEGRRYKLLPPPGFASYCLRSTDNGETWSGPINLDGPPYDDRYWMIVKDEFSEVSAAQTREGKIMTLIRPYSSPFMWESWSEDGGQTWTPATRGPFPMYACHGSMVSTASGALVVGGRFPGMAVQVSHDDGMTWECYRIDSAIWANGAMYEVEPDVVLFMYGGKNSPGGLRGMFLRVTPDGLEPMR